MITICCALYPEARELIRVFQLKRENSRKHFPVFADSDGRLRLVLTGVGAIAAATAVAELSACDPPGKQDLLINFGSCASAGRELGELCLCSKLTDAASGRSYYPDMLVRHSFEEAELVTAARILSGEDMDSLRAGGFGSAAETCLYDMEAAAVYQAGNYYYGPHQMFFLKVVTDYGVSGKTDSGAGVSGEEFSTARFQAYMDEAAQKMAPFLEQLLATGNEDAVREQMLRRAAQADAERLGEMFHCTVAMQRELEQHLYYRALTGADRERWVQEARRDGRLPAKDKREGKRLFEEFKVQSYLCGK